MKNKNKLMMSALLAFSMFSCSSDGDMLPDGAVGNGAIKFGSTIGAGTTTEMKAAGTQWGANDGIGVYMMTAGQALDASAVGKNVEYKTTGSNGTFTSANPLFYPKDLSNVDFIAYYPFGTVSADFKYTVDVANQANPEKIDLMYANNLKGLNGGVTPDQAKLQFEHQLANISFKVLDKSGVCDPNLKITLLGMNTKANFLLTNGTFEAANTPAQIVAKTVVTNATAVSQALIIPVSGLNGGSIKIEAPSRGISVDELIPVGTNFNSKTRYNYDITFETDGRVVVTFESSITDWTDVPGGDITIGTNPTPPTPGAGTKASPYTVDQVAAKSGETAKWVTGYIVGSNPTGFAIGTPMSTNILLAASAAETDISKCVVVDLTTSTVADFLDIVAVPTLIGKLVKVQGNIAPGATGVVGVTSVTDQEGGEKDTPVTPGVRETYFTEKLGDKSVSKVPGANGQGSFWPYLDKYVDLDNKAPIVYTSDNVSVRSVSGGLNAHMWFPNSKKPSSVTISGLPTGYKNIKLSYNITGNLFSGKGSVDVNVITVKCDGQVVTVPSQVLDGSYEKKWAEVVITTGIPDGMTSLEFSATGSASEGMRITNIRLEGEK